MKKIVLILCAAVLALMSCNKDLTPNEAKQGEPIDVVFNLSATHPDGADTKAVKTAWETGDVVFVFFSKQTAPAYLELKYDGSSWVNTPKSLSFTEGETGNMTAVYLPFGSGATVVADGTSYKFDKTYYSYFLTSSMTYDVSGGEVSGTFNMQIPDGYVQFFVNLETSIDLIEIREPHLTPQGIASITKDGDVALTNVAHGAPLPGYRYKGSGYIFSGILSDDARNDKGEEHIIDYHFTMVINGWKGYYFSKVCTGQQLYRGEKEGRAWRFEGSWGGEITDYKPIDLGCDVTVDGVTKRIYWCSRNLGASSDFPTADTDEARQATWGDYYAWGATVPFYAEGHAYDNTCSSWIAGKSGYNWESCPFETAGDGTKFSKYTNADSYATSGTADGLTQLAPADDAANANLHGLWRIPTDAEWKALIGDKSNWAWDATKMGRTVTRKGGTAWIFLPAAGERYSNGLNNVGSYGYYWSSSLNESNSKQARNFNSGGVTRGSGNRFYGRSVRPVTD